MNKEIWKDIPGYEGLYQASNLGRIRSLNHKTLQTNIYGTGGKALIEYKGKILKGWIQNTGYLTVSLKNKKYSVHRLIAITFIPNPNNYPIINHKDGNKLNNKVENLEWCTYKHNLMEAIKLNLIHIKYNSSTNKIRARKIGQYTLDNKYIKTFNGSVEAQQELRKNGIKISSKNILKVCHNERKTAGNYKWKFLD